MPNVLIPWQNKTKERYSIDSQPQFASVTGTTNIPSAATACTKQTALSHYSSANVTISGDAAWTGGISKLEATT
jgi:hypothetical protein